MAILSANLTIGNECDWYLIIYVPDWIALVGIQMVINVRVQELVSFEGDRGTGGGVKVLPVILGVLGGKFLVLGGLWVGAGWAVGWGEMVLEPFGTH